MSIHESDIQDVEMKISQRAGLTCVEDIAQHETQDEVQTVPLFTDKETKRILRKIDWHLLPLLAALYLLAFLDRSNIGNAKVAGMNDDLNLSGPQYNMALTVFFFPYAFFEVPSNIVLKILKPSLWITILMLSWGLVMTMQGLVQGYHGILVTRIFLGLTECGFFPAATYLLTTWYCRYEVQTRLAVFFSAASIASAFSGLLAYAIDKMDGIGGLEGWRWIFILEGILTVLVGGCVYWLLPDSPQECSFLTMAEKEHVQNRLEADSGHGTGRVATNEGFQWASLKGALFEWKIWLAVIVYWGDAITLYGFTYSAPSIINGLGYSAANAQLLTMPIYILGAISTVTISYLADRYRTRWVFIVGPYSVAMCAFIALLAIPHPQYPGLTYAFLFAIPAGVYPPLITILSWVGNNLAPTWKRAVGMALLISLGNLGGAIGSNIFLADQAPTYRLGYGFGLAILATANLATLALRWAYNNENHKRDAMDESEIRAKYSDEDLMKMGDRSPLYRYVT